jgi:large subunit ribosomal protein L10
MPCEDLIMPSYAKEVMMKELEKQFDENPYAFLSSFDKLSVADISDYRRALEKVSKRSLVVKHAFAKKVFAARKVAGVEKFLNGQVLVTFGTDEPQNISKAIVDFAKTHQNLVPAGVLLDNQIHGQDYVKQLAKLPSRHELLTQVAVRVKSPISGLVLTLAQVIKGFVVALNEVKKQKETQSS